MEDPRIATTTVVYVWLIFTVSKMQQAFGAVVGDGVDIDYLFIIIDCCE